jgi:hypothetical protein
MTDAVAAKVAQTIKEAKLKARKLIEARGPKLPKLLKTARDIKAARRKFTGEHSEEQTKSVRWDYVYGRLHILIERTDGTALLLE